MKKGEFDLDDLADQLRQMRRWAACRLLGMLPGVGKVKEQLDAANIDDNDHQAPGSDHLVDDQAERKNPTINGSRRKRIAAGAGTTVRKSTSC